MFIVFEGNEGSGKSTLVKKLTKHYQKLNKKVACTFEPGGTNSKNANEIRDYVTKNKMHPISELLYFMLSRNEHIQDFLMKAVKQNDFVFCDRFYFSSAIYQGYCYENIVPNWNMNKVIKVNQEFFDYVKIDIVFIILVEPKIGFDRIHKGNREVNKFESLSKQYHDKVYQGYLKLYEANKDSEKLPFYLINGNRKLELVFQEIIKIIDKNEK